MFVLLLHIPILIGTSFANPKICLAFEFTAFIRLGLLSRFIPSYLASWSAMKSWVALVPTIAWVVRPFSLMSTYINSLFPTFYYFIFMFSPTWPRNKFNKCIAPICNPCDFSLSLLDSELLELRAMTLSSFDLGWWIDVVNIECLFLLTLPYHVWFSI